MSLNEGIQNEISIVEFLDNKKFNELNLNMKILVKTLSSNIHADSIIHATKIKGTFKPDINIIINNKSYPISVKKGNANSVHQEKTGSFINYCMSELDMSENEKESLLYFLYGDGTLDGDSDANDRLDLEEIRLVYKEEINIINHFFERNKISLINRFIRYGKNGLDNDQIAEYIYHGDVNNGVICPLNDFIINYFCQLEPVDSTLPCIGPFVLQVWNRNPSAKLNLEDRRHSIQVKMFNCKNVIEAANDYWEYYYKSNNSIDKKKQIGDNSHGFNNQNNIQLALNDKRYEQLNTNLKMMIKSIFPNIKARDIITVNRISLQSVKPRFEISCNGVSKNISISMGNGNAIHQENLKYFLPFCKDELKMTTTEMKALLTFIYGDGTLDGSGSIGDRLNSADVVATYPNEINTLKQFLVRNRYELIDRFLFYGREGKNKNIKSDYVYYGTVKNGMVVSYDDIMRYMISYVSNENMKVGLGPLSIQTWNRNLSGNPNNEHKRNEIQVKWGKMENDIREILISRIQNMGTFIGDNAEYDLVGLLNRHKTTNNKLWKRITKDLCFSNLNDIYAVKVSNTVFSSLSERNVLPKSDVYLIKGKIDQKVLVDNNYWLDEDIINKYEHIKIANSGISCKSPRSKSFTYQKLTIKSFEKLFLHKEIGVGISLFVEDSFMNDKVLSAWGVSKSEFISYIRHKYCLNLDESSIYSGNCCKIIKNACIKGLRKLIDDNPKIKETIFKGKHIFEEPYCANYIYTNGEIQINDVSSYTITTGSGRHRDVFTIVIKP